MLRESFSEHVEELLHSNFSRLDKGKPCDNIRMEILAGAQDGQCPYCSLQDASSIDHILERTTHPEFAVLRLNLAPVCETCNREKERTRSRFRGRPRLHLHFDGFPIEPYLKVCIRQRSGLNTFDYSISRPSTLVNETAWLALKGHFESLNLARRFSIRSQKEMNDRALHLKDVRSCRGPEGVAALLGAQAESVAYARGNGYWLSCLFRDASQDEQFCDSGVNLLG